jgi:RNA polymerase sigma-70 factor (ECF subfamily)
MPPRTSILRNSDERLLADYVAGDADALSHLVELHRPGISCFARRQLGSLHAWSDDVTQDVFVTVARAAHRFAGRSTFRTWLFGITLNICRDCLRRERHAVSNEVLESVPDASLDPLQRLERDERIRRVRAAVRRLTPQHRLALRLRDVEDMSYDEMSHVLGVPVGTVRSRLHNARAALAKNWPRASRGEGRGLPGYRRVAECGT